MKALLTSLLLATLIFSCADESKSTTDTKEIPEKEVKKDCTYALMPRAAASVEWTAYKLTNKVGVSGSFEKVRVGGNKNISANVSDILMGSQFNIATKSINSKNKERDVKIGASFFGAMEGGDNITGKIISAKGTNNVGKCEALLKMNGVEKSVAMDYTVEGENVTLTTTINLSNWNGDEAVASLNKVCSEKHKGEDGKSILWPDVDVKITSRLKKVCQ